MSVALVVLAHRTVYTGGRILRVLGRRAAPSRGGAVPTAGGEVGHDVGAGEGSVMGVVYGVGVFRGGV